MPKGPLRRAQLIAPYGVGAMIVVRDGTSLITAGLDHWYAREGRPEDVNPAEFRVDEWRLAEQLHVDHFCQPPDYRTVRGDSTPNTLLTVPFLRFPQWHYCQSCGYLKKLNLPQRSKEKCPECEGKKRSRTLVQVPIIAMCDRGHIQDFPWREWAHRSSSPTCQKTIRLVGTGSATLGGLNVQCECSVRRSLASVTEADENDTFLSKRLADSELFLCQGQRPWLGTEDRVECSRPLKGSLRSAANVYYSHVYSAIYLQRGANSELMSLLEEPPLSSLIALFLQGNIPVSPDHLRGQHSQLLQPFSNDEINAALNTVLNRDSDPEADFVESDDSESRFRRQEFNVLRTKRDEKYLKIQAAELSEYGSTVRHYFSRIMLVHKLRETRALAGFTRIFPENDQGLESLKSTLRLTNLSPQQSWLPASVVYGEGVFLELREDKVQKWLVANESRVQGRVLPLVKRYQEVIERRHLRPRSITPRFVLLHTLAHLLINRLTFECGYSSAALRERLYVSDAPGSPMAGILIYTAAGDSEGTMGGLVRMGKPNNFEPMLHAALEESLWCSADPICMEVGTRGGQGPDSCNLAACHNCALVPETSCEEFNRFLDRGLVIGDINDRELGFFQHWGQKQ